MMRAALVLTLLASCSSKSDAPLAVPPVSPAVVPGDAATDGVTNIGGFDPRSGMHLDDDVSAPVVAQTQTRPGRPVDITLRSSPTGARVAVDGVPKGLTPAYWEGLTGAEHEFTFVLEGYGMARYRFVPIASGVVHARLEAIAADEGTDAGVGGGAITMPQGQQPAVVPPVPPDAAPAREPGHSGAGPQP